MTSADIRNDLYFCDLEINRYKGQINRLEEDIAELENLQNKLKFLHEDFIDEYNKRKANLKDIGGVENVKMASAYYTGMNEIINGSDFYTANNGIVKAQIETNNKIKQLEADLDEARTSLENKTNWKYTLEDLLYMALVEESNI